MGEVPEQSVLETHWTHPPLVGSQSGVVAKRLQSAFSEHPAHVSLGRSQTGADASHPSVAHDATSQLLSMHANPALQGRRPSVTPFAAQSASVAQQKAEFCFEHPAAASSASATTTTHLHMGRIVDQVARRLRGMCGISARERTERRER